MSDEKGAVLQLLVEHANGASIRELDRYLTETVKAVLDTGKKGKITWTVAVEPMPKVKGMVNVTDDVKATVPTSDRPATLYFASTETGQLSLDHPDQVPMFHVGSEDR